jgi:glycosyltransferase involved in cell wall biosynthesis
MRIGIDARVLEDAGGVSTYTQDLINTLLNIDDNNEYILYVTPQINAMQFDNLKNTPEVRQIPAYTYKALWKIMPIRRIIQDKLDVYHSPSYFLFSKYPWMAKTKFVTSFHGIVFEFYKEPRELKARLFWQATARTSAWIADRIIAVSNKLRQEILQKYKVPSFKVRVTYSGVSHHFKPLSKKDIGDEVYNKYGLQEGDDFIFSIGGESPVKNVITLIKAFALVKKTYGFEGKLVLRRVRPNFELLEKHNLRVGKDIVFLTEWIPREDLVALYNLSLFTVFPSLYEGIGAPVIESMACGKPVIVVDSTAMSEVLGDAGIAVRRAIDPSEWAKAMHILLSDPNLRKKYGQKGIERSGMFRWQKVAQRTLEVYKEVMET